MNDFTFQNTIKVYFGKNQLQNLSKEVLRYGKSFICNRWIICNNMELYDKVMNELITHYKINIRTVVHTGMAC